MPDLYTFAAGASGGWRIAEIRTLTGAALPGAARLAVHRAAVDADPASAWALRGLTSNVRYTTRAEADGLSAVQARLGRPGATCAVLIPIRKSPAWWAMAQDERRAVFEEVSRHTAIGLDYLPAVARRLHHARDLGEPFDFLTWFEFAPEDASAFEHMTARLRATREWDFVDREIEIRLIRAG